MSDARVFGELVGGDPSLAGAYQVTGQVDELGAPGIYRVRLHDKATGKLLRETFSAPDGRYRFTCLANRAHYAVAFDHGASPVNAAISDQLTLEPMP